MAEAKQGYVRTWLSDAALVVFVATVTAYSFAYLYEFGFCYALGIPSGFIPLQTGEIVGDLALLLRMEARRLSWAGGLVMLIVATGVTLKRYRPTPTEMSRFGHWVDRNFLVLRPAAMLTVLAASFRSYFFYGHLVCWEALGFTATILTGGCLTVRQLHGDQLRVRAFEIVAYLTFLVLSAMCIGWRSALVPSGYPFLDRSPNTIVLRVYGDKFVTAQYDSNTGTLTSFEEINSVGEKVHWKQVALKRQRYGK
jgi:hypothetical protein